MKPGRTMTDKETRPEECTACGGRLVDYDDYVLKHSVRRAVAGGVVAAVICGIWAPLFFIVRLIAGGAIGDVGGSILAVLLLKKIIAGVIIGILIGAAMGIGRNDISMLLSAIIGSLGGFFIAAADAMPLLSDAAHRIDVVLVSIIAGILCVLTVWIAEGYVKNRFGEWVGPPPSRGNPDASGG